MTPTIHEEALYTYLKYTTEQIWHHIPNIAHMANMLNGHKVLTFCIYGSNTISTLHLCARNKYAHQIGHRCHICPVLDVLIWMTYVHICASYKSCKPKLYPVQVVQTHTHRPQMMIAIG